MHLETAKELLQKEIDGLILLKNNLTNFNDAVNLILSSSEHLIISGVGKSGHIGCKASATFSSTGTPSLFIHPTEASHGDLGAIKNNIVIMISASGESKELFDLIEYCKINNIKTIGITKNINSTLGKETTICLPIPNIDEACPNNLAPTTSTTCSLALCDALAIAVMQAKQFTKNDFKKFHPGGKLGKILLTVEKIMHITDLPLVDINTLVKDAILEMSGKRLGCVGILDDNKLVGILTDGDIKRHIFEDIINAKISDIMTSDPITINKDMFVSDALLLMNEKRITSFFIVDENNHVLGGIHMHDLIKNI